MERKTTSYDEYRKRLDELNAGRVKDHNLVSRLTREDKKANLTLSVKANVKQQYAEMSKWEKIFVANFYEGKPRPTGKDRVTKVREDIESELARLFALADDEEYFKIDSTNNEFLDKEFDGEINALISRGEAQNAEYYKNDSAREKSKMAEKYSASLQAEYKHIVDFIKSANYEPAFKVLMLRETLLKTYTRTKNEEKDDTYSKKRIPHKTIASHMTLNADVLNTIYNELDNYSSFANLYFAGIAISNKTIAGKNTITLTGVDTFGKGKWIKFEGKTSNKEKYIKNAQELAALVQETPWCTKQLASNQLEQGDFYVFVDNAGKPHIAVKMFGNTVDEVRGLKGGNAQELEDDYRDVAVEFLHKNPEVKDGDKWLAKEEWNARLVNYNRLIESGQVEKIDIDALLQDYFNTSADYKIHDGTENSNKTELKQNLPKLRPQLAKHFKCSEDAILLTNATNSTFRGSKLPWKVILGNYLLWGREIYIGDLQIIGGDAEFRGALITSLGNLQIIGGDAYFAVSSITDLGNLQSIGGKADFRDSQVTSLGNLKTIGGHAYFKNSKITSLGNLQSIGGSVEFADSQITDLGNLKSIGEDVDFSDSQITSLGNLQSIGGYAYFSSSQIVDLSNLQIIGGDAYFDDSKITSLANLQSIRGDAYFDNSQITSLGNLQIIGGDAYFNNSKITDFGNLQSVGGKVEFGDNKELEELFHKQFKREGEGWVRIKTAKAEDDAEVDGGLKV